MSIDCTHHMQKLNALAYDLQQELSLVMGANNKLRGEIAELAAQVSSFSKKAKLGDHNPMNATLFAIDCVFCKKTNQLPKEAFSERTWQACGRGEDADSYWTFVTCIFCKKEHSRNGTLSELCKVDKIIPLT